MSWLNKCGNNYFKLLLYLVHLASYRILTSHLYEHPCFFVFFFFMFQLEPTVESLYLLLLIDTALSSLWLLLSQAAVRMNSSWWSAGTILYALYPVHPHLCLIVSSVTSSFNIDGPSKFFFSVSLFLLDTTDMYELSTFCEDNIILRWLNPG